MSHGCFLAGGPTTAEPAVAHPGAFENAAVPYMLGTSSPDRKEAFRSVPMPADPSSLEPAARAAYPSARIALIGCGGFACTFRVQDAAQDLAVKVLDPNKVDTIREDREVVALQSVADPRVVRYRAAATIDIGGQSFRYLVMDYVAGEPLRAFFSRNHNFSAAEIADLAEDISHGAVAIWNAGLAHRDFNPSNVIVTPAGRGVIVDLGIARHMNLPTLTTAAPFAGAPGWMAPEQVDANAERGDWRSDQFVIGLLLYRMTTGLDPYTANNALQLWRAPADRDLLPVRYVNPAVPRAIAEVIARLTAREPYQRFPTVDDFTDAIDTAVARLRGTPGAGQMSPPAPARFIVAVGNTKNYLTSSFVQALAPDGLAVDARNVSPADTVGWLRTGQDVRAVALLDPVNCWDQSPSDVRPAGYRKLPYGQGPRITRPFADDAARLAYSKPILDYQQASKADVLIAPYLYSLPTQHDLLRESLSLGVVAAQEAQSRAWTRPVWTTIAISAEWTRPASLPTLLSEITRFSPRNLYVLLGASQRTAQPLADGEVLLGVRSLIEHVNAAGGSVVFGRRYSSGLLLLSLGASGWSTGSEGTLQNMDPPPLVTRTGGRGTDWYYVPGLLNSLKISTRAGLMNTHAALLAPSTSYGVTLFQGNPSLAAIGRDTQQRILLHQHNLYAMRSQAAALAALSRPARIEWMRRAVSAALSAYAGLGAGLDTGERGEFLRAWQAVL